ncbi:pyridoxamine 5'-phosphate oxidase family protein [Streptomyces broussonetiae]|uniref:Pyridoxamine 5'-phosphate oxidase family protein n=1 Tax=Streptomyces broussonetiae TaxID=2686304 RepID=A0A6I6NDX8_9ACTN|nr:pyridoxamine 5'-phosphate oxidase family protein [Streptomyces broussonetiae]QHA09059.1 hypothetical protein GQF42_42800 [Streptomyces broussonetiae]
MTVNGTSELDHAQCLALLGACRYGRVVFTDQALPVVVPVSCLLDRDGVVIGGCDDRRLDRLRDGDVVVFQADRASEAGDVTESVTVTGYTHSIHDAHEIDRIIGLAVDGYWCPKADEKIMSIGLTIVDGRRYLRAAG